MSAPDSPPDSPDWPLVKNLQPRLRAHVFTSPQEYRGEQWYVLRDESTGNHLRFNARAYEIIGRLDGHITVDEVWEQASAKSPGDALSQDEVIQILSHLFAADILRSGIPVAAQTFFNRYLNDRRQRRQRVLANPLALRLPLFDPDQFLNRCLVWIRPLFTVSGAILWLLTVAIAGLLALANSNEIMAAVGSNVLSPTNLILLWLLFPVIKAFHELGHAFAVKLWGGEVHEMGITLLVMMPVPYVDASAAWTFRERRKRVLVGAMGIIVEMFLASLALMVWMAVEPGVVKDAALNVFLIGTVSTLLFNANPLLRFDGYFILQDLVEIPNLASRANRYYLYLVQRYLFGIHAARSSVTASGERRWFLSYGLAAFFYRFFILAVIVLFLADQYLFVGVALATWAIFMQIVMPLVKGVRFLLGSHAVVGRRQRAIAVTLGMLVSMMGALFIIPLPLTTHAQGVVWVPNQAELYVATDGFVGEVLVPPGSKVKSGTPVIKMYSPALETRIAVLKAKQREVTAHKWAVRAESRVQSGIIDTELVSVTVELERLQEQADALLVISDAEGEFVVPSDTHLVGRYLTQGTLIGYIINPNRLIVKTVIPQSDIGLVRDGSEHVSVRLSEQLDKIIDAVIVRATPAASKVLPSNALGASGGGNIAVEMSADGSYTTAEKVFQVDLELPEQLVIAGLGGRVYVRFDHGKEPLGNQLVRRGRQLLLSRLSY